MMPNKRNPDPAELVRGRAGTVIGQLSGALALLKGLPRATSATSRRKRRRCSTPRGRYRRRSRDGRVGRTLQVDEETDGRGRA